MNLPTIGKYLSYLVLLEGLFMLPSSLVSLYYGERFVALSLVASAGLCFLVFAVLFLLCRKSKDSIYAREGFVVAGMGWVALSILGAFPFLISGEIPNFIDALFESTSGFTTTGASIVENVDNMSRGLVFWRSFTLWLGGIGVLTFMLLVIHFRAGAGFTLHLLRAEMPGPSIGKVRPKTKDFIKVILVVYLGLSLLNLVCLLSAKMPVFDAMCTTLGTAGTGGFSFRENGMGGYSTSVQTIVTIFMALFGVNFVLYYHLLQREWRSTLRDEELRMYIGFFVVAAVFIAFDLMLSQGVPFLESLRNSSFTVSSLITTTGYSVTDTSEWPSFSRTILLVLMLFGAMSGSTGGGFKMIRVLILLKALQVGMHRLTHPRSVTLVRVNGKRLDDELISRTMLYLCAYCGIALISFVLVSFDGQTMEANFSAVISCINNVGSGPVTLGPPPDYNNYSWFSKIVFALNMLLGRLEIFPILLILTPATWRTKT